MKRGKEKYFFKTSSKVPGRLIVIEKMWRDDWKQLPNERFDESVVWNANRYRASKSLFSGERVSLSLDDRFRSAARNRPTLSAWQTEFLRLIVWSIGLIDLFNKLFIYIVYRLYLLKTIYLRVVSSLERVRINETSMMRCSNPFGTSDRNLWRRKEGGRFGGEGGGIDLWGKIKLPKKE